MKKTKILLVLMCVLLVISACTPGMYQMYRTAYEKTESLNQIEADITAYIATTTQGRTTGINMIGHTKQGYTSEDDYKAIMQFVIHIAGTDQRTTMNTYYSDGYMYVDYMGQKKKMAQSLEKVMTNAQGVEILNFKEDAVISQSSEKVSDGTQLTYKLDGTKVTDAIKAVAGNMFELLNLGEDISFEIGNVEETLLINQNGYVVKQNTKMKVNLELQGQTVSADYNIDMTIKNPGQSVTFTFPDLSQYQETTQ